MSPLGVARPARPRGPRSGGRPRSAGPAPAPDRAAAAVACSWLGCIHSSQPARSTIGAAWPQWSECACVQASSRTCSSAQADLVHRPLELRHRPGSCMPVSTSTKPEPAAIAQALQCGTPGHGSGSRSRHSPGSTRSPRPSSRSRRHRGRTILAPRRLRRCDKRRPTTSPGGTSRRSARRTSTPRWRCWAPGGDRPARRRPQELIAPDGIRDVLRGAVRGVPGLRARDPAGASPTAAPHRGPLARARPRSPGPARFQGFAPNGARIELEGCDVVTVSDELIEHNDAYIDSGDDRPPARAAAAALESKAEARLTQARQRCAPGPELRPRRRARADRRRRLARPRRLPAEDDERLPDRGRRRA